MLRIIVFTQGQYGERILENIISKAPRDWNIAHYLLPRDLPKIIEKPEDFLPEMKSEKNWDLTIFMGESPSAFSLLPELLNNISTSAIIAPVDDYSWLPIGLERQIKTEIRVNIVFPRTFCTLTLVGVPAIDEFAQVFGSPIVNIEIKDGIVSCVNVLRGAPCGSTHFMAEKLKGISKDKAGTRAGTLIQIFPCLASRKVVRYFGDAAIHIAGYIAKKSVEKAITS